LAHEIAANNEISKDSKLLVLAPDGVSEELKNHGFLNLDTF